MSTISTAHADSVALKQALAALQSGQENYAQFVNELLAELEAAQQQLLRAETQIAQQNQELTELRNGPTPEAQPSADDVAERQALREKVTELESDRQALEEELESVRARAVDMAQVITDQKRQMADDQTQWMEEFRQLRRILDKQTKWITQQNESGGGLTPAPVVLDGTRAETGSEDQGEPSLELIRRAPAVGSPPKGTGNADPVIGSVLSQFEFLQRDVARRRKQGGSDRAAKKPSPPEKLN